ncbi:MAG: hypothetical protein LAQ69_35930 [Acidobacteriia bacterium]|nr:hypothetical protein [Terriglobia bacterium]
MRHHSISVFCLALFGALACYPQTPVLLNTVPSRVVGHPNPEQNTVASASPNLVEGREMAAPQGIALDTSVSPNILYVSDTGNNRVLAWQNAAGFANGQPADLVIGQQDLFHTTAQGPGTTFQTGLNAPTGLAVSGGDLYIADTNNNRVLRFRKPFQNQGNLFPDLFIGQPNLNSRAINNNGTGQVGAQGLSLQGLQVNIAFDSAGNLWMTDPGNRRVLRFAAADVAAGGGPLTANLLIGNLGVFTSVQPAVTAATATLTNLFATPGAIAFDPSGRLFVSDGDNAPAPNTLNRVLVFVPPFSDSSSAARIMGVFPSGSQAPSQDQFFKTVFSDVNSIFFIPGSAGKVGLVDQGFSRILLFDSYDKWPDPSASYSPQAINLFGQTSYICAPSALNPRCANGGTTFIPAASPSTLNSPAAAVFSGTDLYVADTLNHRVVDLPIQGSGLGAATRVLGQDRFDMMAPNLIEGKEFDFTASNGTNLFAEAGIAIDSSGDTPHLYVADYFNNRVLGFQDVRRLKANAKADIVIGQADFNSGLCNGTGDPNHITSSTLCAPAGLLVDASGNLYVADSGNGRVLRFPAPFAHQGLEQADLVLGQHNLVSKITDPTPFTMAAPYGLAFVGNSGLLVSDRAHNRVLFFAFTNGTFDPNTDSGKAASKVFGQPDFNTVTPGSTDAKMSLPSHVAADTDSRPYVVDTGNNRVLIFDTITNDPNGASAAFILGSNFVGSPRGIYVSALTGEFWVTDASSSALVRKFPKFQTLIFNPAATGAVQTATGLGSLAVTQDQYGDLAIADVTNRVSFYFPGLQGINGGNFIPSARLAPGMFASICSPGSNCDPNSVKAIFGANTANYADLPNPLPLPTTLGDTQVLFNNQAVPLYYVSPTQINFYVPMGAPTSGAANMEVVQSSTGRVYAAGTVSMATYSPAILMSQYTGKLRQAVVQNQDFTTNSPTNPAARGSTITIYAIGQGFVDGAPPDGTPAPASPLLTTAVPPRVNINLLYTDEYTPGPGDPPDRQKFVSFSGLAPGFVGLWQINVQIPANVSPGSQIPLIVVAGGSFPSTDGSFATTIAVK